MRTTALSLLASTVLLSGCVSMAPGYDRPDAPINEALPSSSAEGPLVSRTGWETFVTEPQLASLIDRALENNRDYRTALLNVRAAEARYGIQRASRFPSLNAAASATETETFDNENSALASTLTQDQASAQLAVTAYELDLFGRVTSLNRAALERYFAEEENAQAARLTLIGAVTNAYIGLQTNAQLLDLAEETVRSQQESLRLTGALFDAGVADDLDVQQARITVERAAADMAQYQALVQQSRNALELLVGEPLGDTEIIPADEAPVRLDLAAGTSSDVLLYRPDVQAAERTLKAANADIGAARAAFFPRITLAGNAGYVGSDIDSVFSDGTGVWSFTPQVSLPIFNGGANISNLRLSKAQREIALAQYEGTIQTAFRETADALAVAETIDERLEALDRLVTAGERALYLSQERLQGGVDNYLSVLDAQRSVYEAQQALISVRGERARNAVALYQALGGASASAQ